MRTIERRGLILAAASAALAIARVSPAAVAPKRLPAQLGFIMFCKTSMADVPARLGPGTRFIDTFFVWRGWYDPTARAYLLVAGGEARGPKGSPLVFQAVLASEERKDINLDNARLKAKDLGRPRLSLPRCEGRTASGWETLELVCLRCLEQAVGRSVEETSRPTVTSSIR